MLARIRRGFSDEQNIAHQTREQNRYFKFLIECLMAFKFYQTRGPNTIKQHQPRSPNSKMFGHQTMFDGVWPPDISRLSRALVTAMAFWPYQHEDLKRWLCQY